MRVPVIIVVMIVVIMSVAVIVTAEVDVNHPLNYSLGSIRGAICCRIRRVSTHAKAASRPLFSASGKERFRAWLSS